MTRTCPACQHPLEEDTPSTAAGPLSGNSRRNLNLEVPEELIPLLIDILRDAHNTHVMHGHGDAAGRMHPIFEALVAARPVELRGFGGKGWARALEGVAKGLDIRIDVLPSTTYSGAEIEGHVDIRLNHYEDGEFVQTLTKASQRGPDEHPRILACVEDTFARFRPMS